MQATFPNGAKLKRRRKIDLIPRPKTPRALLLTLRALRLAAPVEEVALKVLVEAAAAAAAQIVGVQQLEVAEMV